MHCVHDEPSHVQVSERSEPFVPPKSTDVPDDASNTSVASARAPGWVAPVYWVQLSPLNVQVWLL